MAKKCEIVKLYYLVNNELQTFNDFKCDENGKKNEN